MKKNLRCILACIISALAYLPAAAQDSSVVIPLWQNGAPGFESRKNIPEEAKDWWVKSINNPSVTVFLPPKDKANGTSVIVCPGGGYSALVYNAEGVDAAKFLNTLGITAFVLKYRLFLQGGSPYSMENTKQDIFRAMRLVRSRAAYFNIDTSRIGVMGFSAGGELAGWVSYHPQESHAVTPDAIDMLSAKPAFSILIYPGPQAVPDSLSNTAPPAFLLAANGDACCSEPIVKLLTMYRTAKVPVEVHLFSQGAHAFNMGYRSEFVELKNWPQRLADWFTDNKLLEKK